MVVGKYSLLPTTTDHFGHKNILTFQAETRPFHSLHEMHRCYSDRWNDQVGPKDVVYHLGDFAFSQPEVYLERLNGKIKIIPGNHDKWARKEKYLQGGLLYSKSKYPVEILPPLVEFKRNKRRITMCHYPMRSWPASCYGSWHIYGHSHKDLCIPNMSMHVGVDETWGYLWSFSQVEEVFYEKSKIHRVLPYEDIENEDDYAEEVTDE